MYNQQLHLNYRIIELLSIQDLDQEFERLVRRSGPEALLHLRVRNLGDDFEVILQEHLLREYPRSVRLYNLTI